MVGQASKMLLVGVLGAATLLTCFFVVTTLGPWFTLSASSFCAHVHPRLPEYDTVKIKPRAVLHAENAVLHGSTLYMYDCAGEHTIGQEAEGFELAGFHPNVQVRVEWVNEETMEYLLSSMGEYVETPSLLAEAAFFRQHSHLLFNLVSNIFNLFRLNGISLDNNRIYLRRNTLKGAAADLKYNVKAHSSSLPSHSHSDAYVNTLTPTLLSYETLVTDSASAPVAFKEIFVGVPRSLDMYDYADTMEEVDAKRPPWVLFRDHLADAMQARPTTVAPRPEAPRVTIIRRVTKRFLLNDEELAHRLAERLPTGSVVTLSCMDNLPMGIQIGLMRNTDVIFAIEGTAFANALWLPRCATMLEYHTYGTFDASDPKRFLKGKNFRTLAHYGGPANTVCLQHADKHSISYSERWRSKIDPEHILKSPFYPRLEQDINIDFDVFAKAVDDGIDMWRHCLETGEYHFGECGKDMAVPEEELEVPVTPPTTLECGTYRFTKDANGVVSRENWEPCMVDGSCSSLRLGRDW